MTGRTARDPVVVPQAQLYTRMQPFAAHDHPPPRGPAIDGQIQFGYLVHRGVVRDRR
ncbi:MAG: hypothetical protein KAZ88_09830 [Acidimicrobiia bacterium]|nr:hypothetical protein [Acidimicrobiia bacterium]